MAHVKTGITVIITVIITIRALGFRIEFGTDIPLIIVWIVKSLCVGIFWPESGTKDSLSDWCTYAKASCRIFLPIENTGGLGWEPVICIFLFLGLHSLPAVGTFWCQVTHASFLHVLEKLGWSLSIFLLAARERSWDFRDTSVLTTGMCRSCVAWGIGAGFHGHLLMSSFFHFPLFHNNLFLLIFLPVIQGIPDILQPREVRLYTRLTCPRWIAGPIHPYRYIVFNAFIHCPVKVPISVYNKNTNSGVGRGEVSDFGVLELLDSVLGNSSFT
jgi:hypothetical protein